MQSARVRLSTFMALASAVLFVGCEFTGRPDAQAAMTEATEARNVAGDKCVHDYPVGAEQAKCINAADILYVRPFATYPDLFDVQLAERLSVETREAAGQISEADGNLEVAKVQADTQSAALARSAAIKATMPVTCASTAYSTTCY